VLDFAAGRRRPLLAPRTLIERHGVSLAEARAGRGGELLRAALAELADAAEARFDDAEAELATLPDALASAFAPLATARLDLRRWRRAGAAPFAAAAPWRRQWALWLWARRR
jgi:phytoene synthase